MSIPDYSELKRNNNPGKITRKNNQPIIVPEAEKIIDDNNVFHRIDIAKSKYCPVLKGGCIASDCMYWKRHQDSNAIKIVDDKTAIENPEYGICATVYK